jgi:hypothetical protein
MSGSESIDPHTQSSPSRDSSIPAVDSILDEQSRCWQAGEREPVETYLERHPELRDRDDAWLYLIYHEALLRQRGGEKPCAEEYERRFTHLAGEIRRQFALHDAFPVATPGVATGIAGGSRIEGSEISTFLSDPGRGSEAAGQANQVSHGTLQRDMQARRDRVRARRCDIAAW